MAVKVIFILLWILCGVLNVVEVNNIIKKFRLDIKKYIVYMVAYFFCGIVGFITIIVSNRIGQKKWWI